MLLIDRIEDWASELLAKAPPVLWFGNSKSEKPKVLTLGANPSRWEFLDESKMVRPATKSMYEKTYLAQQRFLHLADNQQYGDILTDPELRNEILHSYDCYFNKNPYHWFGMNKANSYNAEGLLRGLDASYFEQDTKYRACHIDLFPFATISNFNEIQEIAERDILSDSGIKNLVGNLVDLFKPEVIVVFGKSNFAHFRKYFDIRDAVLYHWESTGYKGKCSYWICKYHSYKVIGLSVNLGNPIGFDAQGIKDLGEFLHHNP